MRSRSFWGVGVCALVLSLLAGMGCSDDDGTGGDGDAGVVADAATDGGGGDALPSDGGEDLDAGQAECVPETATFWVYDLSVMPPQYIEVAATCRGAGPNGLVFVADDIWEDSVSQESVDVVVEAFHDSTPSDPAAGIFPLTTTTFGGPTDVDENDRVFLLLLELPSYSGHEFDGYIRREDMLGGTNSNEAEILYLDAVRNDVSSDYMLGVIAHEFFHMIHLNHDTGEESWLDESLAEASMILCGYYGDLGSWVPDYADNPNQMLVDNSPTFHYGAGFLFGGYLLERFGAAYLTALVEKTSRGVNSLEETWTELGEGVTFREVLGDWTAANWLDDPTLEDGRYGYEAFDAPAMSAVGPLSEGEIASARILKPTGVMYYEFQLSGLPQDSTVTITLNTASYEDVEVRVMSYANGDSSSAVVSAPLLDSQESAFIVDGVGGDINRVVVGLSSLATENVTLESMVLDAQ